VFFGVLENACFHNAGLVKFISGAQGTARKGFVTAIALCARLFRGHLFFLLGTSTAFVGGLICRAHARPSLEAFFSAGRMHSRPLLEAMVWAKS
jgi:hypothetical protein